LSINLQQRFLYLFADYREAIESQQRVSDELIHLRSRLEEVQAELAQTRQDSLHRERELNDRLMRRQFGDRILLPPESTPQAASSSSFPSQTSDPADNPLVWKQQQHAKFKEDVEQYLQRLNGTGENSTH